MGYQEWKKYISDFGVIIQEDRKSGTASVILHSPALKDRIESLETCGKPVNIVKYIGLKQP